MRIAYFSPLNPMRSGISDYSEELLPYLAREAEIDLYVDGYQPSNPEIRRRFRVYDVGDFGGPWGRRRYDICLYQMGNSLYHEGVRRALLRYPGITVLHDHVLHHLVEALTIGRDNPAGYVREMAYCHGPEGLRMARSTLRGILQPLRERLPLSERVVDISLGLIAHSEYVRQQILNRRPGTRVAKINLHVTPPPPLPAGTALRESFAIAPDCFVVASFGFVTKAKRVSVALRAFKRLREVRPNVLYLIVGEVLDGTDVRTLVSEMGLDGAVRLMGYVTLDEFYHLMAVTDVCVSLRYPTMGETSSSVLRAMTLGKPMIVSDVGWFSELPEATCAKVKVDETEEDVLATHLQFLAEHPDARAEMGSNARAYVEREHAVERSAAAYMAFIREVLARS